MDLESAQSPQPNVMPTYEYQFTVPLHDIDAAGVMFFTHILRHAHNAYEAFMAEIGFELKSLIKENQHLPLIHTEATFLRPIRHGDKVSVHLQVATIGYTSFTVSYRFLDQNENELAKVETSHVLISPYKGERRALPDDLREALSSYLD